MLHIRIKKYADIQQYYIVSLIRQAAKKAGNDK